MLRPLSGIRAVVHTRAAARGHAVAAARGPQAARRGCRHAGVGPPVCHANAPAGMVRRPERRGRDASTASGPATASSSVIQASSGVCGDSRAAASRACIASARMERQRARRAVPARTTARRWQLAAVMSAITIPCAPRVGSECSILCEFSINHDRADATFLAAAHRYRDRRGSCSIRVCQRPQARRCARASGPGKPARHGACVSTRARHVSGVRLWRLLLFTWDI